MAPRTVPHRRPTAPALSWTLLLIAAGVLAWLRIFATWFAQDDFLWMRRAAEGHPIAFGAPRLLSMTLYFRAMHAVAGLQPVAYHAIGLALHLAGGVLVFRVLARRLPAAAAATAALVFLTSPALFTALHWVSAIAEPMSGVFVLLAVWLLLGRDGDSPVRPWLAVAAYALSLMSKEVTVGAAPLLAWLQWRRPGSARAARALVTLALAGLAALGASGAWQTGAGEPYALSALGVLRNLPAAAAAAVAAGLAWHAPSDVEWARLPQVQVAGWCVLGVWLAALIARRSREAWFGFAWFVALLAPVLGLQRQFYFYYIYCALPGLVASVAFLLDLPARRSWARPVIAAAAVALLLAQVVALEVRATSMLQATPLPSDFVLRRAFIARNALTDIAPHREALRPRVVMLGQQSVEWSRQGTNVTPETDFARDPWWDENVRGAIAEGEAIRLVFPIVREVVFSRWLEPVDTASTILPYRVDGHLSVTDYAGFVSIPGGAATLDDHLRRAGQYLGRRLFQQALDELLAARALAPERPEVLINLGALQATMGDSLGGLTTLAHAVRVVPGDADALYNLGLLQWRLGRRAAAESTWARLLQIAPNSDLAQGARDVLAGRAD